MLFILFILLILVFISFIPFILFILFILFICKGGHPIRARSTFLQTSSIVLRMSTGTWSFDQRDELVGQGNPPLAQESFELRF